MVAMNRILNVVPLLLASCFFSSNAAAEAFVMLPVSKTGAGAAHVSRRQFVNILDSTVIPRSPETTTSLVSSIKGGETENSKSFFKKPLVREMLAEFIGTFLIVQIGTGSVMSAIYTDSLVGLFQIASVWIIAVTVAICTTASISGAHLNPAVSLAFALVRPSKEFNWRKVLPYSLAQLLGAIAGSGVNLCLYSGSIAAYESANGIARGTSSGVASAKAFGEYFCAPVTATVAFLAEAIGTGILGFVIFALTNAKNTVMQSGFVPPIIGLTVGSLIAVLAPLTQAGFNPARDFGPRIIAFLAGWKTVAFQGWWVYVLAPLLGATAGAFLADKVLYADD